MVEVIKHGRNKTYTAICPNCGCQATCGEEDLIFDYLSTGKGSYIICPDCGGRMYIYQISETNGFRPNLQL